MPAFSQTLVTIAVTEKEIVEIGQCDCGECHINIGQGYEIVTQMADVAVYNLYDCVFAIYSKATGRLIGLTVIVPTDRKDVPTQPELSNN